eukprot:524605-Hanusia_phi.AAC.4
MGCVCWKRCASWTTLVMRNYAVAKIEFRNFDIEHYEEKACEMSTWQFAICSSRRNGLLGHARGMQNASCTCCLKLVRGFQLQILSNQESSSSKCRCYSIPPLPCRT